MKDSNSISVLMNQIRKNYFENKLAYVKSYYETDKNEFSYIEMDPEEVYFFKINIKHALKQYLKKNNLYEQSKSEFDDIYNNIEYLI